MNRLRMFSQRFDVEEAVANVARLDAVYETGAFAPLCEDIDRTFGLHLTPLHANRSETSLDLGGRDARLLTDAIGREIELVMQVRALPNYRETALV